MQGAELAPDLKIVSENVFEKSKGNALTSEEFKKFIDENEIDGFYVTGADATVCVKSTCYNFRKANYEVDVLSDCITGWDKKKLPEMLSYYENNGCNVITLNDLTGGIVKPLENKSAIQTQNHPVPANTK